MREYNCSDGVAVDTHFQAPLGLSRSGAPSLLKLNEAHIQPMAESYARLATAFANRYRIDRELGAGGMATVYLAEDLKHHRQVAVKVFRPELAATIGSDRFTREIEVAARLQHPHILSLHDSGEIGGFLYYVMPYVEGVSLRERLTRQGELPIADAVRILTEIVEALAYAHRQGVVHRDLKPDNIMLSGRHPMVMDFGIAKAVSASTGSLGATTAGVALGTPAYMAPEQAVADPQLDHRVDIYAFGVIGYELLTGQSPFTGRSAQQVLAAQVTETPTPISVRRSTVPAALESILMRCLQKRPADRPQTAEDVLHVLEAISTPGGGLTPTGARPVTGPARPRSPRRRSLLVGAVVALAATLGLLTPFGGSRLSLAKRLSTGLGAWSSNGGSAFAGLAPQRIAVLYFKPFVDELRLAAIADGLTEGLIDSLGRVPQLNVVSAGGVAPYRGLDLQPDSVARTLQVAAAIAGTIRKKVLIVEGDAQDVFEIVMWLVDANSRATSDPDTLVATAADIVSLQGVLPKHAVALVLERQNWRGDSNAAWLTVQEGRQLQLRAEASQSADDTAAASRLFGQADSAYARAEAMDGRWSEPIVRRAALAYRRSRLAGRNPALIRPWLFTGIAHADRALTLDPDDTDALETRGTMRYWGVLSGTVAGALSDRWQQMSQRDLERATELNPAQAGAWAALSFAYNQLPGKGRSDVIMAAKNALAADEFAPGAILIRNRLANAAYDDEQFDAADEFCTELEVRNPGKVQSIRCRLLLQSIPDLPQYDIPRAWRLVDSLVTASAPRDSTLTRLTGNMFVAATIARAAAKTPALKDSARAVAHRAEGSATMIDVSRELMLFGAMVANVLGDRDDVVRRIGMYIAVSPESRAASFRSDAGWWFRSMVQTPAWKRLVGAK